MLKLLTVVGLGLASPLLTGALLGTALDAALGAPAGRLLLWMSLGIALLEWRADVPHSSSHG